jgi:hypothetical protein
MVGNHKDIDTYTPADKHPRENEVRHDELSAAIARYDEEASRRRNAYDEASGAEMEALEAVVLTVPTSFGGVLAMLRFHRGYHIDPAGVEDMSHEMAIALTESVEKALLKLNAA